MEPRVQARHPLARPGSCSAMWADTDEPVWGSASRATFWVALEQPGPWGKQAFKDSRLDPDLAAALHDSCADAGGRALLIRNPREHQDAGADGAPRRLYVAGGCGTATPWLLSVDLDSPADVLSLPYASLAGPDPEPALAALPSSRRCESGVLLVCTNGKRDACCALLGRPIAVVAGAARPGQVWECTHTGGHRFAPTAVALPGGVMYARLTVESAVEAVDSAGRHLIPSALLDADHLRGLTHLSPAAQAADAHVRAEIAEADVTALTVDLGDPAPGTDGVTARVTHTDGRTWDLVVTHVVDDSRPLRSSCVADPIPAKFWTVTTA